jgi:RNA polymerase sigma-70 factor (family 1)
MAAGDEQAFNQLFNTYKEKLAKFAIRMTASEVAAEEIVQEVFIKFWVSREKLGDIDDAGNYLFILTRNKTLDFLRRVASNRKMIHELWVRSRQAEEGTDNLINLHESQEQIAIALAELSTQKQEIFRLSRQEGCSHEEIAERLNLSRSRVKNVLVEVLKHLREHLAKHFPEMLVIYHFLFRD